MNANAAAPSVLLSPARRRIGITALVLLSALVLGMAASVPFVFPSLTLWYKTGVAKILLQTGKVAGLLTLSLLAIQVLLAVRLRFIDRVLGLDRAYRLHRFNGLLIVTLAVVHAGLVLLPEGLDNLPVGWEYWPEMVGALALLLISGLVVFTLLHRFLGLRYHRWRLAHRITGYAVVLLAGMHVLFVSDSFAQGIPRLALLLAWGGLIGGLVLRQLLALGRLPQPWRIGTVQPLAGGIIRLVVFPPRGVRFAHAPGQFVFVRIHSAAFSAEPHPFTIASDPGQVQSLELLIKKCGDWTGRLPALAEGSTVRVEGPYGLFSFAAENSPEQMVFVAGGIGITPMLSMLRSLAAWRDQRQMVLLWSVRDEPDPFFRKEFEVLRGNLPGVRIELCRTGGSKGKRLDRRRLADTLTGIDRSATVFLCGPEEMIRACTRMLHELGFRHIRRERFAL